MTLALEGLEESVDVVETAGEFAIDALSSLTATPLSGDELLGLPADEARGRGVAPTDLNGRGETVEITGLPTTFTLTWGDGELDITELGVESHVQAHRDVLRLSVSYRLSHGRRQQRIRNINAPFPGTPLASEILMLPRDVREETVDRMRPLYPNVGNIHQLESTGRSVGRRFRVRLKRRRSLQVAGIGLSGKPELPTSDSPVQTGGSTQRPASRLPQATSADPRACWPAPAPGLPAVLH